MRLAILSESVAESQPIDWEGKICHLLEELSSAQHELLDILGVKRAHLARGDASALAAVQVRELSLIQRLNACQQRRDELLALANEEHRPAGIATLANSLPGPLRAKLGKNVPASRLSRRLLQSETLSHWVSAQHLLLDVSHWIETFATGRRASDREPGE